MPVEHLHEPDTALEHPRARALPPEQTPVHLVQAHVLEAEDARRVVVRDEDAVHVPDARLEAVLEECGANEIVVLPLETLEISPQAANLVS